MKRNPESSRRRGARPHEKLAPLLRGEARIVVSSHSKKSPSARQGASLVLATPEGAGPTSVPG